MTLTRPKLIDGNIEHVPLEPEELAQRAADEAAASTPADTAAIDQASLNEALAAPGSVFRGFVLVMLDEINILRTEIQALKTKTSTAGAVPQRTLAQIKPAIQAKMR